MTAEGRGVVAEAAISDRRVLVGSEALLLRLHVGTNRAISSCISLKSDRCSDRCSKIQP